MSSLSLEDSYAEVQDRFKINNQFWAEVICSPLTSKDNISNKHTVILSFILPGKQQILSI
jgi:hypothetical protein